MVAKATTVEAEDVVGVLTETVVVVEVPSTARTMQVQEITRKTIATRVEVTNVDATVNALQSATVQALSQ